MKKKFNEWVYLQAIKYHNGKPTTVLFKEVWMVHKAIAYISKERAAEWKGYVGDAVNITYTYDDDDNMVIEDVVPMHKKGE